MFVTWKSVLRTHQNYCLLLALPEFVYWKGHPNIGLLTVVTEAVEKGKWSPVHLLRQATFSPEIWTLLSTFLIEVEAGLLEETATENITRVLV